MLAAGFVAGWRLLGPVIDAPALGGEMILLVLGFGFIPDLIDGNGDPRQGRGGPPKHEAEIRHLLDSLGQDFHVLHSLESPHGRIGHVVFSRSAGVFLVEAKPDPEDGPGVERPSSRRPGVPSPHILDQCVERSYWLRDRITAIVGEKPWITPLLVVPNAFVPQEMKVSGVRVINTAALAATLSENAGRRRKSARIWEARRLIADSIGGG